MGAASARGRRPAAPISEEDPKKKRIILATVLLLSIAPSGAARADAGVDPLAATRADMEATLGAVPSFFAAFPPAALTRHWSTWINGMAIDGATFRREFDAILRHGAEAAAGSK